MCVTIKGSWRSLYADRNCSAHSNSLYPQKHQKPYSCPTYKHENVCVCM